MREFIEKMRKEGFVVDITGPCSPDDMKAAQQAAATDKILFFHHMGSARTVMNVTADRCTLASALGMNEKEMVKKLSDATFDGKIVNDGKLAMKKPDLSRIPVMHFFPKDAGKYFTAGIVFSKWDGVENASIHRMLVLDNTRVAARLVEGRHTHVMLKKALACGERLPLAVVVGVHPAVMFASCTRYRPGRNWRMQQNCWVGRSMSGSAATGFLFRQMQRSCSKGLSVRMSPMRARLSISRAPTTRSGASR